MEVNSPSLTLTDHSPLRGRQLSEVVGGGGNKRGGNEVNRQLTPQERRQYDWYMMEKYERADMTGNPTAERERISMIMTALFPHHNHMPLEREVGKKKSPQGETPGESREEIKARTAAQKHEQQAQRAKAQQSALRHAALPGNVHHMSTRQKAQSIPEPLVEKRSNTPSPSRSSSNHTSSSSSSTSSPAKGKRVEQKDQKAPEEKPQVPIPSKESTGLFKPPSQLFQLAKRLTQKTTVREPEQTTKAAQEAIAMPPPDIPTPQPPSTQRAVEQMDGQESHASDEQGSHESNYASLESPNEDLEESSTAMKKRRWTSFTPTPAGSEDEMGPGSLDLQSHDPRPESLAMAQWAQGLGATTASTADMEQPVLTRPLTLATNERVMEAGQLIHSILPFNYDVNETHAEQEFRTPKHQLPAWKKRHDFIERLDRS